MPILSIADKTLKMKCIEEENRKPRYSRWSCIVYLSRYMKQSLNECAKLMALVRKEACQEHVYAIPGHIIAPQSPARWQALQETLGFGRTSS